MSILFDQLLKKMETSLQGEGQNFEQKYRTTELKKE